MTTKPREGETPLEDGDYCAVDDALWIRVNNVAIQIRGDNEGVSVNAFIDGNEDRDAAKLDSMWIYYGDAETTE